MAAGAGATGARGSARYCASPAASKKKISIPSDVDWIPYWIWSPVAIVNVYPVQLLMGRSTFSPTWNETVCVLPVWYAAAGTAKARMALSTKATDTPEFQGHRIPSGLEPGRPILRG